MKPSTPIAGSKWMWCLSPCPAQGLVDINNAMWDVYVWTESTRKSNALSPSETEIPYAVPVPLSPCVLIAIKIKVWTGFATGTISNVGFLCSNVKPRPSISKQAWLRVPVAYLSFVNFNKRWDLSINSW